jgi:hypothetical protein
VAAGMQLRIRIMSGVMLHHWVSGSQHFVPTFSQVKQSSLILCRLRDPEDGGPLFH